MYFRNEIAPQGRVELQLLLKGFCCVAPMCLYVLYFKLELGTTHQVRLCVVHPEQIQVQTE